ncbi:MAG: hypothetical protein ACYTGP_10025 [Planctomycetota bacterium]|jgi:hypothetical protein
MRACHVSCGVCVVTFLALAAGGGGTGGPPTEYYFGFPHRPLGQAQLSGPFDLGHDHLVISNIGSSGDDGVEMITGGTGRFATEMILTPTSAPAGAHMKSTTRMVDAAGAPQGSCSVRLERRAVGDWIIEPDYSPLGSSTYSVRVFAAGVFVGGQSGLANATHDLTTPADDTTRGCVCTDDGIWTWDGPNGPIVITDDGGDGPTVLTGDRVEIRPDTPLTAGLRMGTVEVTAAGITQFSVTHEAIGLDGIFNIASGEAHADHVCHDCLVISNIGSSGDDGVESELPDIVGGFRYGLSGATVPAGASLELRARGARGTLQDVPLGRASLVGNTAGLLEASADVSDVGGTLVQWSAYLGGVLQTSGTAASGAVAGTIIDETGPPIVVGAGVRPVSQPCWTFQFRGHRCWIRLGPGGPMTPLDELRLLAVDAPPDVQSLSSVALLATNSPPIQVDSATQFCFADLNGNGARDFADILQIISKWGPCAACNEDLDGDFEVGFAEILTVIGLWGPCPS